jgi:hypothetical protein
VAGACVLVAAVLSFLMFCGKGGDANGEGEAEHLKASHPYADGSELDGDSKVCSPVLPIIIMCMLLILNVMQHCCRIIYTS